MRDSGMRNMERPTIWSSRPDAKRRTVCMNDESMRRARYGRLRPMESRQTLLERIASMIANA